MKLVLGVGGVGGVLCEAASDVHDGNAGDDRSLRERLIESCMLQLTRTMSGTYIQHPRA